MFDSQSCGAAALVAPKKARPVVTASSATMAFSGRSAEIEAAKLAELIAPVAGAGGASFVTGAGVERAPTSSASISSAAIRSSSGRASTCPSQSGGLKRLGLSG